MLKHCLDSLVSIDCDDHIFKDMFNVLHLDEKCFDQMKPKKCLSVTG